MLADETTPRLETNKGEHEDGWPVEPLGDEVERELLTYVFCAESVRRHARRGGRRDGVELGADARTGEGKRRPSGSPPRRPLTLTVQQRTSPESRCRTNGYPAT